MSQFVIAKENLILATQRKSPTVVKVFPGGVVNVNTGTAGSSNAVGISPPIPGLTAANVYDAIALLAPREFSQATPASTWTWNHNLGFRPTPRVYNLAYQEIDAEVRHPSVNQLQVIVNPAQPGFIII